MKVSTFPKKFDEFQDTELGPVPVDWEVLPLEDFVSSLDAGVSVNSSNDVDARTDIPCVLKTSSVFGGVFFPDEAKPILRRDLRRAKIKPERDSIIISRMNTPTLVGECGYVANDYDNLFLPDRLWITRHKQSFPHSVRWLAYVLSAPVLNRALKDSATGTSGSMKNIPKSALLAIRVPTPPTQSEQAAIAEALSDADALIEGLEKLIAKKRLIKQGAMQELLTGKRRLPGFGGEWCKRHFGELVEIRNTKQQTYLNPLAERCIELEQMGQGSGEIDFVTDARDRNSIKYVFQKGDVLFGRLRPYLRKYYKAPYNGVCSTEIWPLIPRAGAIEPGLLFQIVQTDAFIEAANSSYGTHMPRSDWKALAEYKISLPVDIAEQSAIGETLEDLGREITAINLKLTKARQIKQGLMQELLTGRIRLI